MKVIQLFFLGGGIGLVLALGLAAAFFLSPWRQGLYLDWDPEIAHLRGRMHQVHEQAIAAELGIAEGGAGNGSRVDSLKRVQAGAWKEYRHWRNRLGELTRHHDRATPAGFAAWAWSMRLLTVPGAAVLFLVPSLLLAWRGARNSRMPRVAKPSKRVAPKAEALASFESAVKQVARLAAGAEGKPAVARSGVAPAPVVEGPAPESPRTEPARPASRAEATAEPETEFLSVIPRRIPVTPAPEPPPAEIPAPEPSPYEVPADQAFPEPGTSAPPLEEDETMGPEGMDTQIIKLGPEGWGEARRRPAEPARPAREALSMEDEDARAEEPLAAEEPASGAFMPPTTEVERVERRKAEVLKLARKGLTSSEISRRMRISQDQVEFIIRMRREKG